MAAPLAQEAAGGRPRYEAGCKTRLASDEWCVFDAVGRRLLRLRWSTTATNGNSPLSRWCGESDGGSIELDDQPEGECRTNEPIPPPSQCGLNGKFIAMIVDGARSHRSKDLLAPENIRRHRLLGYSPPLNPQEHVWDKMREKSFANRVFPSMAAVVGQLEEGLPRMAASTQALRSLADYKNGSRTSSNRRLAARPDSVSLDARGLAAPHPFAFNRPALTIQPLEYRQRTPLRRHRDGLLRASAIPGAVSAGHSPLLERSQP